MNIRVYACVLLRVCACAHERVCVCVSGNARFRMCARVSSFVCVYDFLCRACMLCVVCWGVWEGGAAKTPVGPEDHRNFRISPTGVYSGVHQAIYKPRCGWWSTWRVRPKGGGGGGGERANKVKLECDDVGRVVGCQPP